MKWPRPFPRACNVVRWCPNESIQLGLHSEFKLQPTFRLGWEHSQVLPFISLNMRSFDRETAPEDLKVNPPPFRASMQRFELTLGSLRTRKAP